MERLSTRYEENLDRIERLLRYGQSFDIVRRCIAIGEDEITFYFIDGFMKDDTMQKVMLGFMNLDGTGDARTFIKKNLPYVEVDLARNFEHLHLAFSSGATIVFGSAFGDEAVIIDTRTYPSRSISEPDTDRVMQGAKDGFVETLVFNTALIRRRIRDPRLTMKYINTGGNTKTDVVICYLDGKADLDYVAFLQEKITNLRTKSMTLGMQSLLESLIKRRWYNPFPKVRRMERPDAAAAEIMEGRILVICDTSPQAIVLPTSIFDFMQETEDFYFPPITGCYLRLVRHFVFLVTLFLTPLWLLLLKHQGELPGALAMFVPQDPGEMPILFQLLMVELAIDGLKLASMNTPNMLANSLSVIGALILGDIAVGIGWVSPDVILYMAIVAIGSFIQQSYELGYAMKFVRLLLLIATGIFGLWGFVGGCVVFLVLLLTNKTLNGKYSYLEPLIPFRPRRFLRLFFRLKKRER